jgi:hypothetical protein
MRKGIMVDVSTADRAHSTATVRQHRFGFAKALSSPVGFG